jgi:hypothetical protein
LVLMVDVSAAARPDAGRPDPTPPRHDGFRRVLTD